MRRKWVALATHQQGSFQIPFFSSGVPNLHPENLRENNISERVYRFVDSVIRDPERATLTAAPLLTNAGGVFDSTFSPNSRTTQSLHSTDCLFDLFVQRGRVSLSELQLHNHVVHASQMLKPGLKEEIPPWKSTIWKATEWEHIIETKQQAVYSSLSCCVALVSFDLENKNVTNKPSQSETDTHESRACSFINGVATWKKKALQLKWM